MVLSCSDACELRSCLPQNRDILVRIFPVREQIFIRRASFRDVARHRESSRKTQLGQSTDATVADDPAVSENLLKFFCRGLPNLQCRCP